MLWFAIIALVIVTGVAVLIVASVQRKHLQRDFRLQIANEGNVPSRYQVRAEEPDGALNFQMRLDGDKLPQGGTIEPVKTTQVSQPVPRAAQETTAKASSVGQTVDGAMQTGGALAQMLSALGSLLPPSIGGPLLEKASQLRMGQMQVNRAKQLPGRVSRLKSTAKPAKASKGGKPASGKAPDGLTWFLTPTVEPGETLDLEMTVKSVVYGKYQTHLIRALSRSIDQENAPLVIEEGAVQMEGGFWARRFLPYLPVLAIAIILTSIVYWLASNGTLTW